MFIYTPYVRYVKYIFFKVLEPRFELYTANYTWYNYCKRARQYFCAEASRVTRAVSFAKSNIKRKASNVLE